MMTTEDIKKMLGIEAATFVTHGMIVGLGTGSTANYLINALAERKRGGLEFTGVPTSAKTKALAEQAGIPLIELDDAPEIDLAIDGADEVSEQFNLIKGGGGAMLQEKMVAYAARKFLVMVDESKLVKHLGAFPLPVEVVPYGWKKVQQHIEALGCKQVKLRIRNDNIYVTDQAHYILDCYFETIADPVSLNQKLKLIPGIVETGLFLNMADGVLVGYRDGHTARVNAGVNP